MKDYENTFVRGPSPSYSDEGASTFSSLQANQPHSNQEISLEEKCGSSVYVSGTRPTQGRNTFAFWTVVVVLLVLAVGNLILTLAIIGVLHLGKGIQGLELNSEESLLKFYGSTDLDRLYMKGSSQIDGFADVPITIEGEEGASVHIRLQRNTQFHNRLSLDDEGIQLRSINNFEIKDPSNGNTIFTTHRPHYNMPNGAETLLARTISASRITSPLGKPLNIEGDNRMSIKGSEGIFIDGETIVLQSEHSITINGTQTTMLEGGNGIFLDMEKIPIVSSEFGLRTGSVQYKICACMPQGILFRIPIPRVHNGPKITCAHFSSVSGGGDPCGLN